MRDVPSYLCPGLGCSSCRLVNHFNIGTNYFNLKVKLNNILQSVIIVYFQMSVKINEYSI